MTKETISICLPSKGRKFQLERMISSASNLAKNPKHLEFSLYLDNKDLYSLDVPRGVKIVTLRGPVLPTSTMMNIAFSQCNGSIIMYGADDIVFRTRAWDEIVRHNMPNPNSNLQLVIPNDLSPNRAKVSTHGFVTRRLTEVLHYLLPPYFESEFSDTWITDVCKRAKVAKYLENLQIEHMHPSWGKSTLDDTYAFRKSRYKHKELYLYFLATTINRRREARSIRQAVNS